MNHEPRERHYIIWQNRAFRFYLGSRLLYLNELRSPAAFCAQQALELLVKATLVYWDKSFSPKEAGHGTAGMLRTLKNKVKGADSFQMPMYFFHERRYQSVSRYPSGGKGLGIPAQFLEDLDRTFSELVTLVPFQFNSELIRAVSGRDKAKQRILEQKNEMMSELRQFLLSQ